jgi:hypothetical protein
MKTFIQQSTFRLLAGLILVLGAFTLAEVFFMGNDDLGLRLCVLGQLVSVLFLLKSKWAKQAYKYELSCIATSFSLGASELIKFSQSALLAASILLSKILEKASSLLLDLFKINIATGMKTVFASYFEAKARLKSALRSIAVTLTPKLLPAPSANRA